MLALTGLWQYEQARKSSQHSLFILFGQESLLVYVVHLMVVYGHTYEWSFIRLFGPRLSYVECAGLFIGLALAMYVLGYVWHWLKGWNRQLAWFIQFAVLASFVVAFLVKDV